MEALMVVRARFEGAEGDDELKHLAAYLSTLKDEPNVRTIEKRRWRERIASD
jgi:RNA polymerase II subunit A small phosphatase-like protein